MTRRRRVIVFSIFLADNGTCAVEHKTSVAVIVDGLFEHWGVFSVPRASAIGQWTWCFASFSWWIRQAARRLKNNVKVCASYANTRNVIFLLIATWNELLSHRALPLHPSASHFLTLDPIRSYLSKWKTKPYMSSCCAITAFKNVFDLSANTEPLWIKLTLFDTTPQMLLHTKSRLGRRQSC